MPCIARFSRSFSSTRIQNLEMSGDLGLSSDDFELLDLHHDVLSLSETETSEGGESESRAAAAIIEALEEPLQGLEFGTAPQFLGGIFGATPPAAGQTYTVDLGASPKVEGEYLGGVADAAGHSPVLETVTADPKAASSSATVLLAAIPATPAPAAAVEQEDEPVPGSSETAAVEAGTNSSKAANPSPVVLLCFWSAAALATLLLLLAVAASSSGHYHPQSQDPILGLATQTFHTTATKGLKPAASSNHGLTDSKLPAPLPAAEVAQAAVGAVGGTQNGLHPWMLFFNASNTLRRNKHGSSLPLPALPASLQRVRDSSTHANMSSTQRLRLHLWLLHCAARDAGGFAADYRRSQVEVAPPAQPIARKQVNPTPPAFSGRAHHHPFKSALALHCAALAQPKAGMTNTLSGNATQQPQPGLTAPAGSLAAQRCAFLTHASLVQWWAVSGWGLVQQYCHGPNSTTGSTVSRSDPSILSACPLSLVELLSNVSTCSPVAALPGGQGTCSRPQTLPLSESFKAKPAAPTAPSVAAEMRPSRVTQRCTLMMVPPTRPIPPMFRPPLPCLLLGGWRPNRTDSQPQHTTAHQGTAGPGTRSWANITTRVHQAPWARVQAVWGAKPFTRAFAVSMLRWSVLPSSQQAGVSGPPTFPMLPPVAVACVACSSSNQEARANAATAADDAIGGGLSLPMLPPVRHQPGVAAAAAARVPQQQHAGDEGPSTRSAGGLTLPMLPPVSCFTWGPSGGLTLPMLPPVTCNRQGVNTRDQAGFSSPEYRSAIKKTSSRGFMSVGQLDQPPIAAAVAAADRLHVSKQYNKQQGSAASTVAAIKRKAGLAWLYQDKTTAPSPSNSKHPNSKFSGKCTKPAVQPLSSLTTARPASPHPPSHKGGAAASPFPPVSNPARSHADTPPHKKFTTKATRSAPRHGCTNNSTWASAVAAAATAGPTLAVASAQPGRAPPGAAHNRQQQSSDASIAHSSAQGCKACSSYEALCFPRSADGNVRMLSKLSSGGAGVTREGKAEVQLQAAWVSSLVTLPMLPPVEVADDHQSASPADNLGIAADRFDGHNDGSDYCDENDVMRESAHMTDLSMLYNVTTMPLQAAASKSQQQQWMLPAPVM